jgi:hypothetical protein
MECFKVSGMKFLLALGTCWDSGNTGSLLKGKDMAMWRNHFPFHSYTWMGQSNVLWSVMVCSLEVHWHFEAMYCLHLKSWRVSFVALVASLQQTNQGSMCSAYCRPHSSGIVFYTSETWRTRQLRHTITSHKTLLCRYYHRISSEQKTWLWDQPTHLGIKCLDVPHTAYTEIMFELPSIYSIMCLFNSSDDIVLIVSIRCGLNWVGSLVQVDSITMTENLGSTAVGSATVTGGRRCAISSRAQHQPASSLPSTSHLTAVRTAQVRRIFPPSRACRLPLVTAHVGD